METRESAVPATTKKDGGEL